jgi:hypothetical protein
MSFDVFISFATEDKRVADATCATLERAGIRCWMAPRDLRPGEEYGSGIASAIDSCKVLVLIFSSSANTSGQVRREVERAVSRGVAILPIRIEDIVPTESLSYFVDAVHWMDAITPPLEDHLQRLAELLKTFPFDGTPNQQKAGYSATTKLSPSTQRDVSDFRKKTRLALIKISSVLLVAAMGAGVWSAFSRMSFPGTLPVTETNLLNVLARAVAVENRPQPAREYPKLDLHRALAVAPRARNTWRTGPWPTREQAEEKVIERCSQFYNEACAIVSVDDAISVPRDGESWSLQDAPRLRYVGLYNPERIPGLREGDLGRPEVAAYATVVGPKAAAFNAEGILEVVIEAPDQRTAEERALAACTGNPIRKRSNGPCYLYAVGNQVVLPLRSIVPLTAATPR